GADERDGHRREAGDDDQRRAREHEPDHAEAPPRRACDGGPCGGGDCDVCIHGAIPPRGTMNVDLSCSSAVRGVAPVPSPEPGATSLMRNANGWGPARSALASWGTIWTATGTQRDSVAARSTSDQA